MTTNFQLEIFILVCGIQHKDIPPTFSATLDAKAYQINQENCLKSVLREQAQLLMRLIQYPLKLVNSFLLGFVLFVSAIIQSYYYKLQSG